MRNYFEDLVLRALRKNSYLTAVDPNEKGDLIVQDVVESLLENSKWKVVYRFIFDTPDGSEYILEVESIDMFRKMMIRGWKVARDAKTIPSFAGIRPSYNYRVAEVINWAKLIISKSPEDLTSSIRNLRIETVVTLEFVAKTS